MTLYQKVTTNLCAIPPKRWQYFEHDAKEMLKVVQGWTTAANYGLFESALEELPSGSNVLVCGVYHGADLRLMDDIATRLGKEFEFYGVDIFSNVAMEDWTDEQLAKGVTWEDAVGLPAPSMANALVNCPRASILRADSVSFMQKCDVIKFDWIYLDTAHTYEQVVNEIQAARHCIKQDGLISGDDFSAPFQSKWGVDKAVRELLPEYTVVGGRVWYAPAQQMFNHEVQKEITD